MLAGTTRSIFQRIAPAILFAVAAVGLACWYLASFHAHFDADSYFHMAVARLYSEQGLVRGLAWARLSVMAQTFGDKELLFHLLLVPFVRLLDPHVGSLIALALLDASVLTLVAMIAVRLIGPVGYLVPAGLLLTSTDLVLRLIRLRPELLSLILLLAFSWLAMAGRHRWLAAVAILYSLSYTAFQVPIVLAVLWFVAEAWRTRRPPWRLLIYPTAGVGAGLLLHPYFPDNLLIWWWQNVEFFRLRDILDVGTEIDPESAAMLLLFNWGWFLSLAMLWRSSVPRASDPNGPPAHWYFSIAAVAFVGLAALMQRFSLYAVPFATLALCEALARRTLTVGRWIRLPWDGRVSIACAAVCCLAAGGSTAYYLQRNLDQSATVVAGHPAEWRNLSAVLPVGAQVAAPWTDTETYVWAAPQASYLNLLDPIFMALRLPREYARQRALWQGIDPDSPLTVRQDLASDYIAFSVGDATQAIQQRLQADSRLRLIHEGFNLVYELDPAGATAYVRDWSVMPLSTDAPAPSSGPQPAVAYPRAPTPRGQAIEAYIDGRRLSQLGACAEFVHIEHTASSEWRTFDFAPYGPAALWIDDQLIGALDMPVRALLGRGLRAEVALSAGAHRYLVRTCRADQHLGFYLRQLPVAP